MVVIAPLLSERVNAINSLRIAKSTTQLITTTNINHDDYKKNIDSQSESSPTLKGYSTFFWK